MRQRDKSWVWFATCSMLVSAYGMTRSAHACNEMQHLCVEYNVDLDDDWGDAIALGPYAKARGIRITIIRPPPEPPLGLYLDEEGCVDFPTQFAAGHMVVVHPSAILGGTQNIRISAFAWDVLPLELPDLSTNVEPAAPDYCYVPPVADDSVILVRVPSSPIVNIMAIATSVVHTLDSIPGTVLGGEHDLRLIYMSNVPESAWHDSDLNVVALGAGSDRRKFVVAHEIGHWIQSQAQIMEGGDADWTKNYSYPLEDHIGMNGPLFGVNPEPACRFAVDYEAPTLPGPLEETFKLRAERHGIRSAEYSTAAMTEAFGHFVAAVAFNSTANEVGTFIYYKDLDVEAVPAYQDLEGGDGLVQLPGTNDPMTSPGGETAWLNHRCESDWDVLHFDAAEEIPSAVSSEIDWLRFFWEFLTSQDSGLDPQPGFWDVARLIAYTWKNNEWSIPQSDPRVWERMIETFDDSSSGLGDYKERFEALNATHLVWNDPAL